MVSFVLAGVRIHRQKIKTSDVPESVANRAVIWYQDIQYLDVHSRAEELPKWKDYVLSINTKPTIKRFK